MNKASRINTQGYVFIGKRYEHRVVWEEAYGYIPDGYEVHHINGNTKDNRLENLRAMSCQDHMRTHSDNYKEMYDGWHKYCKGCKTWKHADEYSTFMHPKGVLPSVCHECRPCNSKRALKNYYKRKRAKEIASDQTRSNN